MTAKEARVASNKAFQEKKNNVAESVADILNKIKEAVNRGECSVKIKRDINTVEYSYLLELGYTVTKLNKTMWSNILETGIKEDCTLINW